MSDEVEVVIIATGFNNQQNGITAEAQESALRQATLLSRKIDGATFGGQEEPYYNGQAMPYAQPMPNYGAPSYAPVQGQAGYAPYPAPAQQPSANEPFEPDDPIPQPISISETEETEKKRRPKFVDFFMKKNSDNK